MDWSLTDNYREIEKYKTNKLVLSTNGLRTLREKLSFKQLRFFCHKKIPGRTFDIATTTNSSGQNVTKYFTAETDDRPKSCGSYYPLFDDNSTLAGQCARWGHQSAQWGPESRPDSNNSLMDHAAFVEDKVHWVVHKPDNRWECDDYNRAEGYAVSYGDFWKIFVR